MTLHKKWTQRGGAAQCRCPRVFALLPMLLLLASCKGGKQAPAPIPSQKHWELAEAAFVNGLWSRAEHHFSRYAGEREAEARCWRAQCLLKMGRVEDARTLLATTSPAMGQPRAQAFLAMAKHELESDNPAQALALMQDLTNDHNAHIEQPSLLRFQWHCLRALGETERATQIYTMLQRQYGSSMQARIARDEASQD